MLHESNIKLLILLGIFVCLLTVVLCADCRTPYAQAAYASADDSADEIYNDEVSVDPFGYFNGRWNIWEYIGDTLASLFQ